MRRLALVFAVPFLLATGCGDDKSSGGGGTPPGPVCLFPGEDCFQLAGTFTPANLTDLQAACTGFGGTYTASSTCSTAATVAGYCSFTDISTFTGVTVAGATARGYYYTATYDATTAGLACTADGGTWVAGGGGGTNMTLKCTFSVDGVCGQITGTMTATDVTNVNTACVNGGGTPATGACTTTGAVSGHCHYTSSDQFGVVIAGAYVDSYYYTAAGWTLLDAQADCAFPPAGAWVP